MRTLALNPPHPILARRHEVHARDEDAPSSRSTPTSCMVSAAGGGAPLPDPAAFSRRIAELMTTAG